MNASSVSSASVRLRATSSISAWASSHRQRTSSRVRPRASAAARAFCASTSPSPSRDVPLRSDSTNAGMVLSQYARWPTISFNVQPAGSFSSHRGAGSAPIASRIERWAPDIFPSNSVLEIPRIVVLTEHLLQDKYLFADACVCSRALQEPGHQLIAGLRGLPKGIHRFSPAPPVAGLPRLGQSGDLLFLDVGIDRQSRDRRLFGGRVLVDPNDDLLPLLDLLLEVE